MATVEERLAAIELELACEKAKVADLQFLREILHAGVIANNVIFVRLPKILKNVGVLIATLIAIFYLYRAIKTGELPALYINLPS